MPIIKICTHYSTYNISKTVQDGQTIEQELKMHALLSGVNLNDYMRGYFE